MSTPGNTAKLGATKKRSVPGWERTCNALVSTQLSHTLYPLCQPGIVNIDSLYGLRGPTHQKWSNFVIFGFIVQFDPWVGAHLWKKN